jgi:glycosyltransferase involved in cell wall biosynthesis
MNYAEALASRGDHVDVIALRKKSEGNFKVVRGVSIYKIQERSLNEYRSFTYFFKLLKFFLKSTIILTLRHSRKSYDLIHIHTIPDFQVFCTFIAKLTGSKVILDIHDLVPELYANKFGVDDNSLIFKALLKIEQISAQYADHVILANHIWGEKLKLRANLDEKSTVFINYYDSKTFHPRPKVNKKEFIAIYPGSLNYHQGLDIAIKALSLIRNEINNFKFYIYGEGPQKKILRDLIERVNLTDIVFLNDQKPIDDIAEIIASADLGIVPKRNDFFGSEAFSTKILEFMSSGVPVILSKTKIDSFYFNDEVVKFFEPENEHDLAKSILLLLKDDGFRNQIIQNALRFSKNFSWQEKKSEYYTLVDSLIAVKKITHTL